MRVTTIPAVDPDTIREKLPPHLKDAHRLRFAESRADRNPEQGEAYNAGMFMSSKGLRR